MIEDRIDIAAPVRCDAGRLQQLASNLLANALVHGTQDRPIEFVAETCSASLTIAVANSGTPIATSDIAKVFKPFWRHSTTARREGLGLGQHICDQIVRAHGGALEVAVDPDGRTRFIATLPLAGPGS